MCLLLSYLFATEVPAWKLFFASHFCAFFHARIWQKVTSLRPMPNLHFLFIQILLKMHYSQWTTKLKPSLSHWYSGSEFKNKLESENLIFFLTLILAVHFQHSNFLFFPIISNRYHNSNHEIKITGALAPLAFGVSYILWRCESTFIFPFPTPLKGWSILKGHVRSHIKPRCNSVLNACPIILSSKCLLEKPCWAGEGHAKETCGGLALLWASG